MKFFAPCAMTLVLASIVYPAFAQNQGAAAQTPTPAHKPAGKAQAGKDLLPFQATEKLLPNGLKMACIKMRKDF